MMEALPVIVPVIGLAFCWTTGWGCVLSRQMRLLRIRIEALEQRPVQPPTQTYYPLAPTPIYQQGWAGATAPPYPSAPAMPYEDRRLV